MSPPPSLSRRSVLAAAAALPAASTLPAVGGLSAAGPANRPFPDWPMYRYDAAATGYNPAVSGPGSAVQVRWQHGFRIGLGPPTSPVLAGGVLYHAAGDLFALDARDGTRWFRMEGNYLATPAVAEVAAYRIPTLVTADRDGPVGLASDGGLALLGARFGDERWRAKVGRDGAALGLLGSPDDVYPPVHADGSVYAATTDALAAIDASSGRVEWTGTGVRGRPAVASGTVYVTEYPARVRALDAADGGELWRADTPEARVSAPAVAGGQVYVPDRHGVTALAADSGDRLWRFDFEEQDLGGAPAVAEGTVYVASDAPEGGLHALDATTGDRRWTAPFGADSGGPVVADGTVYVGNGDGLHAVDATTGDHRWSFEPAYGSAGPPVVAGGLVFVAGHATVYALEGVDG